MFVVRNPLSAFALRHGLGLGSLVLAGLFAFVLAAAPVAAQTLTHRPNGTGATATAGNAKMVRRAKDEAQFASLALALADTATADGDELQLAPGVYSGGIVLTKGVKLVGSTGYTPLAGPTTPPAVIIDGGNAVQDGIVVNSGVTGASISGLEIRNFTRHCIHGQAGNHGLTIEQNVLHHCADSGVWINGDVDNVTIDHNEVHDFGYGGFGPSVAGRGIVVWNGVKRDITISNNWVHDGTGCCGIELQDGTATGAWITDNVVANVGDSGMGFVQLTSGSPTSRANIISGNQITNTGRFGIEIKIPNGTGAASGNGAIIVENNIINGAGIKSLRDRAGIAVYRRAFAGLPGQVDATRGVIVQDNTVSGFRTNLAGYEGYGIVVEGLGSTVQRNTLSNNDIGFQLQQGNPDGTPPGDANQNANNDWFGRGNAPFTCASVGEGADANSYSANFSADQSEMPAATPMIGSRVTNQNTGARYCTITSAVAAASNGDTILVDAGMLAENVVVTRPIKIQGAGQALTTVVPAAYNPDCNGAPLGTQGSMCGDGTASIVFLVNASNVEISQLTVDGINPALPGHATDIAARNGIMSSTTIANITNFKVHDTTVRNIWLRGIYSPSTNGTFAFRRNTVDNVKADPASIGIFSFYGSGSVDDNDVSDANDAIAANWSKGIIFENNRVSNSNSGIHTDNSGGSGGSGTDLIENNTISCGRDDAYGIFTFANYKNVTVRDNTVRACAIGLGSFGGRSDSNPALATAEFLGNSADGSDATVSDPADTTVGAMFSTTLFQYGDASHQVQASGNIITGFGIGVLTDRTNGKSLATTAHFNRLSGNTAGWQDAGDAVTGSNGASDFENNWWGCNDSPDSGSGCAAAAGNGDFDPWLVLSLPTGPIEIARNASLPISADLNHNSSGVLVASVFPDGTSIAFAANNGANATTPGATSGGVATTTFSGLASGQSTVSATLENAVAEVVVRITQATITLDAPLTRTYDGTPQAVTATIAAPHASASYAVTYAGSPTPPTAVGSYAVVATITDNCCEGSASGTLTITPASTTIEFLPASGSSLTYNGGTHAVTARLTAEQGTACPVTGTVGPNVGSYTVNAAACTGVNYTAPAASANYTVSPQPTTITFSHLTQAYDGSPKSVVATTAPTAGVPLAITYNSSPTPPTAVGSYAVVATITNGNYVLSGGNTATLNIVPGTGDIALVLNGPVDPIHVGDTAQYAATMLANPALHVGEHFGYHVVLSKSGGDPLALSDLATMEVWTGSSWQDASALMALFTLDGSGNLVYDFPGGIPGYSTGFPILDPSWTWNVRFTYATPGTYTLSTTLTDGIGGAPVTPTVAASIATVVLDALPATDIHLVLGGPAESIEVAQVAEYTGTLLADPSLHVGEDFFVKVTISKSGGHALVPSDLATMQMYYGGTWTALPPDEITQPGGPGTELVYYFPKPALPGGFQITSPSWTWNFRFGYADVGVYTAVAEVVHAADAGNPSAHVFATAAVATTVVAATPHLPDLGLLLNGPLDDIELGDAAQYTGTLLAEPALHAGHTFWTRIRIHKTGGTHALTATDLAKMELYQGGWQDHTATLQPLLVPDGGDLVYYFPQPFAAFTIDNAIFSWNFRFTYGDTGMYTATADLIDAAEPTPLTAPALASASTTTTVIDTPDIHLDVQGAVTGMVGTPVQYVGTLTADPLPPATNRYFVEVRIQRNGSAASASDIAKAEIFWGGVWVDPVADLGASIPWSVDPLTNELVYLFPQPVMPTGFPIDEPSWTWQFRFTYANAGVYTATATVITADGSATPVSNTESIHTDVSVLAEDIHLTLNGPVAGVEVEAPTAYIGRLQNLGGALAENGYVKVRIDMAGQTLVTSDVTLEVWNGSMWVTGPVSEVANGLEVNFPDLTGFAIPAGFDYTHQFRITYHRTGVFHATATVRGATSGDAYASAEMFTEVVPQAIMTASVLFDPASLHATFDGNAHAASATTVPPGLALVYTYDGGSTVPTAAGSYVVQASVNDALYTGSATAVLTIDKAPATVTINAADLHQSTPVHAVGAVASVAAPLPAPTGTISLTYDGSPTLPTLPGTYTVVATLVDPNYTASASATLVVGDGAAVTISLDSAPAMALVGLGAPYTDLLDYTGSVGNSGSPTTQNVHVELTVVRIDDGNGTGGMPVAIAADDVLACVYDPAGWAAQEPGNHHGCPNDYASLFLGQAMGSHNGRTATIFRYPNLAANDAVMPNVDPPVMLGIKLAFKAGEYQLFGSIVGADGHVYASSATARTTVPNAQLTYNGPTAGQAEDALLSQTRLTNTGGRADGNVIVKVTLADVGGATLAPADAEFAYQLGGSFMPLPWTQAGSDLVTWFGPPTGFPLEDGYDAISSARAIFHREGSYTVTYDVLDAATHAVLFTSTEVTPVVIGPNMVSFALSDLAQVYDGTPRAVTVTPAAVPHVVVYEPLTGPTCPATPSGSNTTPPTNAGSYCVYVDATGVYQGGAQGTLVVAKAAAAVTLDDDDGTVDGMIHRTYDGSLQVVAAHSTPAVASILVTYNGDATPPEVAGTYSVVATVVDPNYSGSASGTLIVAANGGATITLDGAVSNIVTRTYNGTPQAVTATTTPGGISYVVTYVGDGGTLYPLSTTPPSDAGQYHVVASTTDANYAPVSATGTLVIAQANAGATITLDDDDGTADGTIHRTYSGGAQAVTATTNPTGLAYAVQYVGIAPTSYGPSAVPPTNVGSYAVTAGITDPNYTGITDSATLVIAAQSGGVVTFDRTSFVYNGQPQSPLASMAGDANVSCSYAYLQGVTPLSAAPTAAGSYEVTATCTGSNTTGSASTAFTIAKATGTVAFGPTSFTFDGSAHSTTAVIAQEPATSCALAPSGDYPRTHAGSTALAATCSGSNYDASGSATLDVAAKSVTIALSGLGPWVYDGSAHPATVSVGGEVAGFAATVTVTYTGSTIAPSAVGSYAVVAALDAAVTDYVATPASGVLVIGAQNATVTLGDLGAVYDGTAHAASATTQPSGLAVSLSYDGSGTAPTNAGSYAVVATITTPGYSGAASGTLVITKASATVTIGDTTQAWDGTPRAVSVVTVPAGLTVDVSYDGSASAPSAVGSYAVLASVNETNYSGSAAATLIITSGAASTLAANGATTFTGTAGQALAAPLPSVKVTDAGGNPVAGVAITFSAGAGSGTLSGASPTTDQNGIATLGGWILDTMPGTNTVTASAVGVTGTVTFTAEGAAVAGALSATITDGRVATQVGRLLTYTITVGNGGSAAINAVTVTDTLPGELDAATASWQCIAINGASCTASGSGNLADSVNLPAGSGVVYLLNARVIDDLDGMIDNSVTVSGGGDSLVRADSTEIVIFRDGFELGGDGAQWSRSDELANAGALSEDKAVTLALDAAALAPLQRVVLAQAADGAFSVEAIRIDARVYLRLVVADVASAWSVAGDDHIALVLVGRHLSLVGAESELSLDLPQGGTFMLERLTRH